jgi:tRNA acetyltransferase TAN1
LTNSPAVEDSAEAGEVDIEASIEAELASMKPKAQGAAPAQLFQSVRLEVMCVIFFKVDKRIDTVDFVQRICEEVLAGRVGARNIMRLTPMVKMERAIQTGLLDCCTEVLGRSFVLEGKDEGKEAGKGESVSLSTSSCHCYCGLSRLMAWDEQYAIRPTIRNHSNLKRNDVIQSTASLVSAHHKVDLTNPDKIILLEIYQVSPHPDYAKFLILSGHLKALIAL